MNLNDLRMSLKAALDNMWARIDARIHAIEEGGGGGQDNVIEAISFNGTNVPPDANKRVSLTETDPTVPAWAKAASKPTYTAYEVGALPASTSIPSKTSDLTNDSGFLTSSTGVTGVKGDAEASYRQGNVNLTAANIGAVSTSDVINVAHGGTGATDAALHIENDYSSVLNVINAVRNTRIFPISVQKSGTTLYSDMPTTDQTDEWNLLLVGNSTRITATLYLFAKGSGRHIYVRDFYNGNWFDSQWTQIH